jgi:aspartate carbamoyltransferase regulatory subunit
MSERELRISKIQNGTVVDHVPGGQALNVLAVLGIDGTGGETVSIGMNVESDTLGRKDVVKVGDRGLSQDKVDVLSLSAPENTISIIRDFDVVEKKRLERPESVSGVLACPNHDCITADDEPVVTKFEVLDDGVRCVYCETIVREDITDHIVR